MTLLEWAAKQPSCIGRKIDGAVWIPDFNDVVDRLELWSLSDYRVDAVSGGSIWLYRNDGTDDSHQWEPVGANGWHKPRIITNPGGGTQSPEPGIKPLSGNLPEMRG